MPPIATDKTWRVFDKARQQKWRIEILFEDDALLVLHKPAGLPVIPERYHPEWPCLQSIANEQLGTRVFAVHRIDLETSGVLLFAKNAEAHRELCRQFAAHEAEKIYWALVRGEVASDEQTIDLPLSPHPKKPGVTIVNKQGKPARTHCRVLERFRGFTWVELKPQTGRQHQIRVHLKALGHPLLVDSLYANTEAFFLSTLKSSYHKKEGEAEPSLIRRLTLHAQQLGIFHPTTKERMTFTAEAPKDFNAALKHLRKYAAKR
ncbi:RluA family pseudouridine synthase [candidate division KSB1 bacterium]|nr:RluA family pseudouridine synthase [candidate division KSB1 bacterium]